MHPVVLRPSGAGDSSSGDDASNSGVFCIPFDLVTIGIYLNRLL